MIAAEPGIISLSSIPIDTVNATLFPMPSSINILEMESCGIKNIVDNAFADLINMEELILNHNELQTITANTFKGANGLQVIFLKNSKIKTIENGAFDLPVLEEIHLDSNELKTIPTNLFSNAPNLNMISLPMNRLENLNFELPIGLIHFDVGSNPLSAIDLGMFLNLENLKFLYLDNTTNMIQYPNEDDDRLSNLLKLDLTSNVLPDADALFEGLSNFPSLEYLGISVKNLANIDDYDMIGDLFPELKIFQINHSLL